MFWTMTMTMELELWLRALESGEFTQTKGVLRREDGHCCLGVACELYQQATRLGEWRESAFAVREDCSLMVMPAGVGAWLGLHDDYNAANPFVAVRERGTLNVTIVRISQLNDHGLSFTDIAKVVRANLDRAAYPWNNESTLRGGAMPLTSDELAWLAERD